MCINIPFLEETEAQLKDYVSVFPSIRLTMLTSAWTLSMFLLGLGFTRRSKKYLVQVAMVFQVTCSHRTKRYDEQRRRPTADERVYPQWVMKHMDNMKAQMEGATNTLVKNKLTKAAIWLKVNLMSHSFPGTFVGEVLENFHVLLEKFLSFSFFFFFFLFFFFFCL